MDNQQLSATALILFYERRNITFLFRNFIEILEELTDNHDDALLKLHSALPSDFKKYVELADYLPESKCDRLRKKILDLGNDSIRSFEEELGKYKVEFK